MSSLATPHDLAADAKVTELVALAAAVGSNCEACFRSHYETARDVGVSDSEIIRAVSVAQAVKETPARRMLELAARKLDVPPTAFTTAAGDATGDRDNARGDAATSQDPSQAAASADCC